MFNDNDILSTQNMHNNNVDNNNDNHDVNDKVEDHENCYKIIRNISTHWNKEHTSFLFCSFLSIPFY
jgi:hypothetical protein